MEKRANRLIGEKSPYLLQHAYNPVEWYPWGEEAFEKAVREEKPVFLSIGYSTCHWCHVMEKESFEDSEVADLMNKTFVSIKVDREERTDIDHVYMTVCQMLTGSGGWPLSIIMTPQKVPFFAGTYLPKSARFGRVGMMELIPRIRDVWTKRRDEVLQSADKIFQALRSVEEKTEGGEIESSIPRKAYQELSNRFDRIHGGFSDAPKFPTTHNLSFLLRFWKRTGEEQALDMVRKTLTEMRKGGIYDQIGYGFHRYSTDREWLVPHFEKMLYDQATLSLVYLEAYQAMKDPVFERTPREVFTYVLRDMKSEEGGFYSAEDADSEGVEGKFYLWREAEVRQALSKEEAELAVTVFGIKGEGNFVEEATKRKNGTNILHLKKSPPEIASELHVTSEEIERRIETIRGRLFEIREKRVRPYRDDKVLTDWNGLMIAALARGAALFSEQAYADAARDAARFILTKMRTPTGRLLHRYRDGDADITAHLDDYAFFIWGLIELYEATFEVHYLKTALDLSRDMLAHYWDEESGGFFFVPDDGESLLVRKKEIYDGAVPSGNSAAMFDLLRLARLTGDSDLERKAAKTASAFSGHVRQIPSGFTHFLSAADMAGGPSYEVVISGALEAEDTREMLRNLRALFAPNMVILHFPSDDERQEIEEVAPFVKGYGTLEGKTTVYVCSGNSCKPPTTSVREMLEGIP